MPIKLCQCGGKTRVLDSREHTDGMLYRRRVCPECDNRFSTYEIKLDTDSIYLLDQLLAEGPHPERTGRPRLHLKEKE